jgi:hypothetical protein
MRRRSALLLLGVGSAAAAAVGRRLAGRGEERADLYFEDGSMVSLPADAPAAQSLFPIARDLLSTVGP